MTKHMLTAQLRRESDFGCPHASKHWVAPLSDGPMVRTVVPDSEEWVGLEMGKRLEGVPHLETLIRSGRAMLVLNGKGTSTCDEKAAAAGIHPDRVVKTICAKEIFGDERYLIVSVGPRRIRLGGVLGDFVEGSSIGMAEEMPPGMAHGTCTPFVPQDVAKALALIAIESPAAVRRGRKGRGLGLVGDLDADISIGGTDEIAHRLSLRMKYSEFAAAILDAYGDRVAFIPEIARM